MKKIILTEDQLKLIIEKVKQPTLFDLGAENLINHYCVKGQKKFEKNNPWCDLKKIRSEVGDELKQNLDDSIKILFNFYKRPYKGVLPKIIELSLTEAYKERTISFLKSIADFIKSEKQNVKDYKLKKALKSLQNQNSIDTKTLEKLLELVRMANYSAYEESFVGQNFELKRGKLQLNYKCEELVQHKNFFDIIKHLKSNPELFEKYFNLITKCIFQSFTKTEGKGDLVLKTPLFVLDNSKKVEIFPSGSVFEVKGMDYGVDSYLSEFFSVFKKTELVNLKSEYLETYNNLMQKLYEWCEKNGAQFLVGIKKSLSGIVFDKNIIIPINYVDLYWSNRGQKGCDEKRLSIRFKVKENVTITGYRYNNNSEILEKIDDIQIPSKDKVFLIC
jgi:hypothetical protein